MTAKFNNLKSVLKYKLSEKSRTAKLWFLYMDYIDVMKLYILAARTRDWELCLYSLQKMINLFAATGHINYAKSARLYLQIMLELPVTHPWLYIAAVNQRLSLHSKDGQVLGGFVARFDH